MTTPVNEPHLSVRASMQRRLEECSERWLGQRSQNDSIAACDYFITCCLQIGVGNSLAICQHHIDTFKLGMENRGLSASTINTRLVAIKAYINHCAEYATSCGRLSDAAMLSSLSFTYKTRTKQAKWHMTDEQYGKLPVILARICTSKAEADLVHDYITWTFETGLRVEETLRLLPTDFEALTTRPALNVPGTKNEHSRVRIPISNEAAVIIIRRSDAWLGRKCEAHRVFDISYTRLRAIWEAVRMELGLSHEPTATLKALRRNFALNALRKGLAPRLIQELMRHSSLETTMGYLRLMGMSDNDETRALLNRQLLEKSKESNGQRSINAGAFLRQLASAAGQELAIEEELREMQKRLASRGINLEISR